MCERDDTRFMRLSYWSEAKYIAIRTVPISVVFLSLFTLAGLQNWGGVPGFNQSELIRCCFGAGLGIVTIAGFTAASRWLARVTKAPRRYVLFSMLFLAVISLQLHHPFSLFLPIVSIYRLLAILAGVYIFIMFFSENKRLWIALAIVVLPLYLGMQVPNKYIFRDLQALYECPAKLTAYLGSVADQPSGETTCGVSQQAPVGSGMEGPVKPQDALNRFSAAPGRYLVVVAASGGAYRATFWTALILDKLQEINKELTAHIRLLTGASGGMVGAAYFASLSAEEIRQRSKLVKLIEKDILDRQSDSQKVGVFLPRDSLSPVLQQFAMRDVLFLLLPLTASNDRGEVLQGDWRRLAYSFSHFWPAAGDANRGWHRPSMIISPMILETGQPLLVSDLDLHGLVSSSNQQGMLSAQHTLEFFRLFPGSRNKLTLATAVRMSATFPIVSPAVDLPTEPRRRVVDAGYFDNYGMATALAYLRQQEVIGWIERSHLKGAIIIQINAFPVLGNYALPREGRGKRCEDFEPKDQSRLVELLTTPIVGLEAARERGMVQRGEQELTTLKLLYASRKLTLERIAFENTSRSSLSWYLPDGDLQCLEHELEADHIKKAFSTLNGLWPKNAPVQ
jgi:predicted acylesterase/phospholipase RssA